MSEETNESFVRHEEANPSKIPVPTYNPRNQIQRPVEGEKGSYNDADLYAISAERTRALREIQGLTATPVTLIGGLGLEWSINHTDPSVGRHFDAHGIAKGDPIPQLHELLTSGIRPDKTLYTMPYMKVGEFAGAFGAEMPKTEGGIIVISGYDRKLATDGIDYVVVGEEYNRAVDLLRIKYPQVQVIPWHDAQTKLTNDANTVPGNNSPIEELTENNRPYYARNPFVFPEDTILHIDNIQPVQVVASDSIKDDGDIVW